MSHECIRISAVLYRCVLAWASASSRCQFSVWYEYTTNGSKRKPFNAIQNRSKLIGCLNICYYFLNRLRDCQFFPKKSELFKCNGQTKVVGATIQRHSSQNCLISQWWPSKVDLSTIKYFCRPMANTCTNISITHCFYIG